MLSRADDHRALPLGWEHGGTGAICFSIWKRSADSLWYWSIESIGSSKRIATASAGHHSREDCLHAISMVRERADEAGIWDVSKQEFLKEEGK